MVPSGPGAPTLAQLRLFGTAQGAFHYRLNFSSLAQHTRKSGQDQPNTPYFQVLACKAGPSFSADNLAKQSENEMTYVPFFKAVIATLIRWSDFTSIRIFGRN